jgi:sigma-B regulation protein RsbU (phosphoserine phosphatase)
MDVSWRYEPAFEIGGDLVQFLDLADGGTAVLVADVAGKGVPAALVVSRLHQATKLIARWTADPFEFLSELNETICEDLPARTMVTALLMTWSADGEQVRMLRAGHCPPLVLRPGKGCAEWLSPQGSPIGLLGDRWPQLENEVVEVPLEVSDSVLLYTDGITEAFDETEEVYGEDRLLSFANAHLDDEPEMFVEALLKDLRRHSAQAIQSDDITLAYLKRTP